MTQDPGKGLFCNIKLKSFNFYLKHLQNGSHFFPLAAKKWL